MIFISFCRKKLIILKLSPFANILLQNLSFKSAKHKFSQQHRKNNATETTISFKFIDFLAKLSHLGSEAAAGNNLR